MAQTSEHPKPCESDARAPSWLSGGGEAGERLRALAGTRHPLGSPQAWPPAIRHAVSLCLASPAPIKVLIGTDPEALRLVYNDAYRPVLGGDRHPEAFGALYRDAWPELWSVMRPIFDGVLSEGRSARWDDEALVLNRNGRLEDVWLTHAYSPIRAEAGGVVGVLSLISETTDAVQAGRLSDLRAQLAERLQAPKSREAILAEAEAIASGVFGRTRLAIAPAGASPPVAAAGGCVLRAPLTRAGAPDADLLIVTEAHRAGRGADRAAEEIARAVGAALDREVREHEEREKAERLDLALEAARLGYFRWDRATGLVELSPRAAAIFGVPAAPNLTWDELVSHIHAEDLEAARAAAAIGTAGGTYETHYRYTRPADGETVWIRVRGRALTDRRGEVVGRLGMAWDNTPLKTVEQQLRQERAQLEDLQRRQALLLDVSEAAREAADAAAAADLICERLGRFLGVERVGYAVVGDERTRIHIERCWTEAGVGDGGPLEIGDFGLAAWSTLWSGAALVIDDAWTQRPWSAPATLAAFKAAGVRATICLPIRREGRLAALFFADSSQPRRWTPKETELVAMVAERLWTRRERGRAEQLLKESEAQLRVLAATVPAMVFITDSKGSNLYVNEQLCAYTGLSREALLGDGWRACIHPEDRERAATSWRQAHESGAVFEAEYRFLRADGVARHHLVRCQPVPDDSGAARRWVGACIDVQESVEARELLTRKGVDLAREVAERTAERDRIWRLSPDLLGVLTLEGSIISANPAWTSVLGVRIEDLVGRPTATLRHPDDEAASRALLAGLKDGESRVGFEDRLRGADGRWRWISWAFNRDGALVYCIGRDVTGDKSAQAALFEAQAARAEASAQHRAHFESSSDCLFILQAVDGDFRYIAANPQMAALGLGEDRVVGRTPTEVLGPSAGASLTAELRRCVAEGGPVSYSGTLEIQGAERDFETALVPLASADERVLRVFGAARDVTERNRLDEQLRQSQKMQAVGQLAGGIAHDFNNLLSAVVGSLDLLQRRADLDARARRHVENALGAAERGARLTAQLLSFSRAQKIHREPVEIAPRLFGMRDLLERTLGPRIRLSLDFEIDAPPILADPTQLEMAVLNLAINARDAMPDGGDLHIASRRAALDGDLELAAGCYLFLSVSDTGVGMPPEVLARAFDPFFTTKGVGKGTGLGLSQVYAFARQAEGAVRIRSAPGEGAEVTLILPLATAPATAPRPAAAVSAPAGAGAADVLVIDDDPGVRRFLADALETLGYSVRTAEDGEAGLRAAHDRWPDIVLLDYGMPGLSGAQTAEQLKRRRADTPVIFVSGYADTAAIEAAVGAQTLRLAKPFRVEELQAMLSRALDPDPRGGSAT